MYRTRNTLLVIAGIGLVVLAVRLLDGRMREAAAPSPVPDRIVEPEAARPSKIYRMEAPLEELRKIPAVDGMARDDDMAWRALPRGVENSGEWVKKEDVLEAYAHPSGRRFFIIMKPGTRAYSVFVDAD
jgi:hypothetical protein